jgi:hypothetical protein
MLCHLTVLAVLFGPFVNSQSVIYLFVNPFTNNVTLPCGTSVTSACPNITSAYMSIPLLSTSVSDNVVIALFPGIHNACDVSYFSLVLNVSNGTSTQLTIQSFNQSLATVTCTISTKSRIFAFDADGLTLTVQNVNFAIKSFVGIDLFSATTRNILEF